jgi:hypothetical protein
VVVVVLDDVVLVRAVPLIVVVVPCVGFFTVTVECSGMIEIGDVLRLDVPPVHTVTPFLK